MSYSLVVGDLEPDMFLTAAVNGTAKDLSDADTVELRWLKPDGTEVYVSLDEVDFELGQVKRTWVAGDSDDAGVHRGRIVATWAGDEPQTFPNDGSWFIWWVYE